MMTPAQRNGLLFHGGLCALAALGLYGIAIAVNLLLFVVWILGAAILLMVGTISNADWLDNHRKAGDSFAITTGLIWGTIGLLAAQGRYLTAGLWLIAWGASRAKTIEAKKAQAFAEED